jgi:ABC-type uncharacterized transport system substrate-binding protein
MENQKTELKQLAAQILSGMLANPHIYSSISDDGSKGTQEQQLIAIAIDMAANLIEKVERKN